MEPLTPLPPRYVLASPKLGRRLGRAGAIGLALLLAACSGLSTPMVEQAPVAGPSPMANNVVLKKVQTVFADRAAYQDFEVSDYRWVRTLNGYDWLACVRFQDHGRPRLFAVFLKADAVIDTRFAVETDNCDRRAYVPLDPSAPPPPTTPPVATALQPGHESLTGWTPSSFLPTPPAPQAVPPIAAPPAAPVPPAPAAGGLSPLY